MHLFQSQAALLGQAGPPSISALAVFGERRSMGCYGRVEVQTATLDEYLRTNNQERITAAVFSDRNRS
jgi:hypothetical protein